jgi:sugar phosphate isomerase/epimerase
MELALTQDTRRPVATAELAAVARAAGFSALGMVSGRFAPEDRTVLADAGLRCHELLGLQVRADAAATIASAERLARDAEVIGAPWVLTTFETPLEGSVRETVARCALICAEAGAGLAIEFSPLGPVPGILGGIDAVAAALGGRSGIVIDAWNFCFGPSTWTHLEQVPLELVAYVQFADALAPLGEVNLEEAMTRRALPGEGVLELRRFANTLRDRGYDGVVSMQVLSDMLRDLQIAEYTRRVYDAGARYWS